VENVENLKIAVTGLGFVGLTTALGFADKGFDVAGYDIDSERAAKIKNGLVPFFEPGLDAALKRTLGAKFKVAPNAAKAAENADAVFFCVGTPYGDDGKADVKYLLSAIDSVINTVKPDCVFVIKSTVPPGTTANVILPYVRAKSFNGAVVNNPEFLREGHCWNDFMNPDRIVCGCDENAAHEINLLTKLYESFNAPVHFVSPNTSEFIKYLSNSLLASLVSFSNEMALIAEAADGVNIAKAFKILHQDKRLDGAGINHYIYPGCGYGGYCLPKDTVALAANAKANGFEPRILDGVISLNDEMPCLTAAKIERIVDGKDEKIGILGLSFKPNSDDVRDSPAAKIIACLLKDGYRNIYAYDPVAIDNFRETYKFDLTYCNSKERLCAECNTIALVTIWKEFADCNRLYSGKKWIDCRYFLDQGI